MTAFRGPYVLLTPEEWRYIASLLPADSQHARVIRDKIARAEETAIFREPHK